MTPFQYENQVKFLMNGAILLCHKQSLNMEILHKIKNHNLFSFGSKHEKTNAYIHFLNQHKDSMADGNKRSHIPPQLM